MKVSIIIPVYNRVEYTQKCLESIFKFGSKYAFEVIVVNNASSDGTSEYLKSLSENVLSINNEKNLGFARACNQGAKISKGEYVLFLNNDTIVTEKWLDVLVDELVANPKLAIAGSKLLYLDETIQHAGVVFGKDKLPYHIYKQEKKDKFFVNKKRLFQAVTGACLLIRKNVFNQVGGFDEVYKNGLEDMDLCLKVKELGFMTIYCPKSVVYHYESITEGRGDNVLKNREIFLSKWKDKIDVDEMKYFNANKYKFKNKIKLKEICLALKHWMIFIFLNPKKFIKKYFKI